MRISLVSISTRSPGCSIRQCLGLRIAHGRFRSFRRACRNTAGFGGSCNAPRRFELHQDAPDHRSRNGALFFSQKHHQLVFAPARILLAQSQHPFDQFRRPGGFAYLARPVRTPFQGGQVVGIESSFPAIKGLSADTETAASACGIPSVEVVEQHPLQASLCRSAYLLPEARQLARLGKITPLDFLHPDTLPSVTNHSERAHLASGPLTDLR